MAGSVERGDVLVVPISAMGLAGDGMATAPDGRKLFVRGGLPGEQVRATITELHANFARGQLEAVLEEAPERVAPPCPVFGRCGGCTFQHWSYGAELRHKRQRVASALTRIGGFQAPPVAPVVPAPDPYGYRAKASFAWAGTAGQLVLGFYEPGSHRVVPVGACAIQDPLVNDVLAAAGPAAAELGLAPFDESRRAGLLRHLVVRASRRQRQSMAMLVAAAWDPRLEEWGRRLLARVPSLAGAAVNLNPDVTNRIEGPVTRIVAGDPVLHEEILGVPFRIAPDAFFQVNPVQVERLYTLALEGMGGGRVGVALDLYAGVGALARLMAERAARVEAVEMNPAAVAEGQRNTAGWPVQFHAGAAEVVTGALIAQGLKPDVAVLDPPRSGVRPAVLEALRRAAPPRIVYVSCRPETLARDLQLLTASYELQSAQPVDMFPRSDHVEVVAVMTLTPGSEQG